MAKIALFGLESCMIFDRTTCRDWPCSRKLMIAGPCDGSPACHGAGR